MRKDTRRRIDRLNRRVKEEALVFPKKNDKVLQRLIKKAKHTPRKSHAQEMKEWDEFQRKMNG